MHDVHGIGRYIGVETMLVDGLHRDYLLLQYAGSDRLFVPVDQVSMLHKYVGSEGITPRLSKMGGADWKRMKVTGCNCDHPAGGGTAAPLCGTENHAGSRLWTG